MPQELVHQRDLPAALPDQLPTTLTRLHPKLRGIRSHPASHN
jgi:hypothetical protein